MDTRTLRMALQVAWWKLRALDWVGFALWAAWATCLGYLAGTVALLSMLGRGNAFASFCAIVALATVSRVRGIRAALRSRR